MLRTEVYEIVQDLAVQDNISVSKAAGILVEAALANRSLWDQKIKGIPAGMTKDPSSCLSPKRTCWTDYLKMYLRNLFRRTQYLQPRNLNQNQN